VAHLAIGGVDGTLERRLTDLPAPRVVRAKTGTLDDAIALSGYVLGPSPARAYAFSVLINGARGRQAAARVLADGVARACADDLWGAR
jgi:D-alanyl-D-alanine carboxypeptidase/D-alanyl-D-alanine-endopeptidase (penicillin-binding protein 4)